MINISIGDKWCQLQAVIELYQNTSASALQGFLHLGKYTFNGYHQSGHNMSNMNLLFNNAQKI